MKNYQKKENSIKKRKALIKKNEHKIKARKLAVHHIKIPKGKLCEKCKKNKAEERHHDDYSKPLKVKFLCKKCHNVLRRMFQ